MQKTNFALYEKKRKELAKDEKIKKYIELAEIDDASNIQLKKKRKEAFHFSYIKKLKLEAILICYKNPKLIGKIFDNNNLDIDIRFTKILTKF